MAWNDQNNNNDPWQRHRNGGNKNNQNSDFEGLLKALKKFLGIEKNDNSNNKNGNSNFMGILMILGIVLAFIIFTGFYTIPEAERGVLLRFGKFVDIVEPGLRFKIPMVDKAVVVNVEKVRALQSSGSMLTEDENVVNVEMDVQYRISNPKDYLFNVVGPDKSLNEATDSALRYVIGHTTMDDVLTSGREKVRQSTRELLTSIIEQYHMGITIVDVNFLPARAPEQVKAAFDDAIAAQEDEQRFKREAEAYENEVLPIAEGKARRLIEEAEAYSRGVVAKAEGETAKFEKILPEYKAAPEITKKRIYLETMESVYQNNTKVVIDVKNKEGAGSLIYLPIDKIMQNNTATTAK